jgi:hypothetical protein
MVAVKRFSSYHRCDRRAIVDSIHNYSSDVAHPNGGSHEDATARDAVRHGRPVVREWDFQRTRHEKLNIRRSRGHCRKARANASRSASSCFRLHQRAPGFDRRQYDRGRSSHHAEFELHQQRPTLDSRLRTSHQQYWYRSVGGVVLRWHLFHVHGRYVDAIVIHRSHRDFARPAGNLVWTQLHWWHAQRDRQASDQGLQRRGARHVG